MPLLAVWPKGFRQLAQRPKGPVLHGQFHLLRERIQPSRLGGPLFPTPSLWKEPDEHVRRVDTALAGTFVLGASERVRYWATAIPGLAQPMRADLTVGARADELAGI